MTPQDLAYLCFGLSLSAVFLAIIVYYYSRKRHRRIEAPKYRMLDDEE